VRASPWRLHNIGSLPVFRETCLSRAGSRGSRNYKSQVSGQGCPETTKQKTPVPGFPIIYCTRRLPAPISAPKPQNPHHHTRIKPTITSHHARLHTNQAPKSTDPQSQTPPPLSRKPTNPVHVPNYAEIPRQPGVKTPCVPKRLKRNKRRRKKRRKNLYITPEVGFVYQKSRFMIHKRSPIKHWYPEELQLQIKPLPSLGDIQKRKKRHHRRPSSTTGTRPESTTSVNVI